MEPQGKNSGGIFVSSPTNSQQLSRGTAPWTMRACNSLRSMITRDRTSAVPVSSPTGVRPRLRTVENRTHLRYLGQINCNRFNVKRPKKEAETPARKMRHLLVCKEQNHIASRQTVTFLRPASSWLKAGTSLHTMASSKHQVPATLC